MVLALRTMQRGGTAGSRGFDLQRLWFGEREAIALPGDAMAAPGQCVGVGATVVVEQATRQQFAWVFALEVVDPAVRGVAVQRTVMGNALTGIGEFCQLFGDRSR